MRIVLGFPTHTPLCWIDVGEKDAAGTAIIKFLLRCSFCGAAGVCSNGVPGVESASGDYCCPASCKACDGDNCYLDGLFCCGDDIEETGVLCDDSEEAPCIIDIGKLSLAIHLSCKFTSSLGNLHSGTHRSEHLPR